MRQGPSTDSSSSGDLPRESRHHDRQPVRTQPPRASPSMHPALPPIHQLQLPPSTSASVHGPPAALHPHSRSIDHQHALHRGSQHAIYASSSSVSQHAPPQHLNTYQDRDERRLPERAHAPVAFGGSSMAEQSGSAGAESDQEEIAADVQGPPKKKRRRQALSCTECKRRKIKCDRLNPCGPCQRRSEPDKCHWHVVEPIEKYVTRAEWDELNTKFRNLEEYCKGLTSLISHFHPELASPLHSQDIRPGVLPSLPSPTSLRASQRPANLSGPGVSGYQRSSPNQPLSAPPSVHSMAFEPTHPSAPTSSGGGAGMGIAPPHGAQQMAATQAHSRHSPASPRAHPPQHSERRTSASGMREQVAERSRHQIPGMSAVAAHDDHYPFHSIQPSPKPPSVVPIQSPSSRASRVSGSPLQNHTYPSDASHMQEGRYGAYSPSLPQHASRHQQQHLHHRQPSRRYPLAISSIVGSEHPPSPSVPCSPPAAADATIASPRAMYADARHSPLRAETPVSQPKKGLAQTFDRAGEYLRQVSPSPTPPPYPCSPSTATHHGRTILRETSSRLASMDVSDSYMTYPRTAEGQTYSSDSVSGSRSGSTTPVMSTSAISRMCKPPPFHFSIPPTRSNPATPPPQLAIY